MERHSGNIARLRNRIYQLLSPLFFPAIMTMEEGSKPPMRATKKVEGEKLPL